MEHGKPQKQAIAIAYSMKRRSGKKKASGGAVESGSPDMNYADGGMINAKNQKRPMPNDIHDDAEMAHKNSGKKPAKDDQWTDQPTVAQARKPSRTPLSAPSIVKGSTFTARLTDQEKDLQSTAHPSSPSEQPDSEYDEEGADRQGPHVRDMQDEHSTHRKPYAKGGEIEEMDEEIHPDGMHEDDLTDLSPSEDEGDMMAESLDEERPDRKGPIVAALEMKKMAKGGMAHDIDDSLEHEEDEEHHDSMAAAIMAKRHKEQHGADSDSDIEHEMYMAEGGMADLHSEHEEEPNNEDQMSFEALKKENYNSSDLDIDQPEDSNEHGHDLEDEDEHDMVSSIRRKMKAKRQF